MAFMKRRAGDFGESGRGRPAKPEGNPRPGGVIFNIPVDKWLGKPELSSPVFSKIGENGGRSSMVELQIVVLAVAGSSPVGHPPSHPGKIARKP